MQAKSIAECSKGIGFQYQILLYASKKYCRMLQGKHTAILLTCIKLPFVFKTFVLSIFSGCIVQKTGFPYMHFFTISMVANYIDYTPAQFLSV